MSGNLSGARRMSLALLSARFLLTCSLARSLTATAAEAPPATNSVAPLASNPAGTSDLLQFMDGSSLHGKLHSISADQGIGWEHPDAKALIGFKPANIAWIRFE